MKKLITILILITTLQNVVAQSLEYCEITKSIILSGEYEYYEVEECVTDIEITAVGENTVIKGITFITGIESLKIIPTEDYMISIKPSDDSDYFHLKDLLATDRLITGNTDTDDKLFPEVFIYPNPVDTELTIKGKETFFSYIITDYYGVEIKKAKLTSNVNVLNLSSLSSGWYFIFLLTEKQIAQKKFYKN